MGSSRCLPLWIYLVPLFILLIILMLYFPSSYTNTPSLFLILGPLHLPHLESSCLDTAVSCMLPSYLTGLDYFKGFLGSSAGKESACNAGDTGSVPGSGRSPGEGIGYPLQCSWAFLVAHWRRRHWHPTPELLPGKSYGRRSLVGCSPWGHWGSDTTEWLHFHFSLFTFMHWRRKCQPTPVFLPGESQGRGSLVGCRLCGHTESDKTEAT